MHVPCEGFTTNHRTAFVENHKRVVVLESAGVFAQPGTAEFKEVDEEVDLEMLEHRLSGLPNLEHELVVGHAGLSHPRDQVEEEADWIFQVVGDAKVDIGATGVVTIDLRLA